MTNRLISFANDTVEVPSEVNDSASLGNNSYLAAFRERCDSFAIVIIRTQYYALEKRADQCVLVVTKDVDLGYVFVSCVGYVSCSWLSQVSHLSK